MRQLLDVIGFAQYAEALVYEHGFERVQVDADAPERAPNGAAAEGAD